jgi:glutamate dehydrogenase/leucine dehydrogenase
LENQITLDNVENIKARVILELANGPIIPEADEILFKK